MITLHPDENLLAVERRHWLPVVTQSLFVLAAGVAPLFFLLGVDLLPFEARGALVEYRRLIWFFYSVWLFGLWMAFSVFLTNYYLDVLIVTDKRLIDIDQVGLFARTLAELRLENIQDVRVEVSGLIPSLLNYGDLFIQTAGERPEFALRHLQEPQRVRELISKVQDAAAR